MRHDLRDDGAGEIAPERPARRTGRTNVTAKRGMNDMLKLLVFVAIWFVLMFFILPRLGVPT